MHHEFPEVVDSTFLATFRSCPRKAQLSLIEHWKPQRDSVHLVAGAAFAAGLEHTRRAYYEHGRSEQDSLALGAKALLESYGDFEPPADSAKSPERMLGALEYYFSNFGWATDEAQPALVGGKLGIEFSFAEPLPVLHPETGLPLIYAGRADMICNYAGGLYIEDDKTATALGDSWLNQWGLRSQFTGYTWAARQIGLRPAGVLVRGIAILKTKYNHAQVPTQRSEWEVERWLAQTCSDLERAKRLWNESSNFGHHWDYNLDHACTEYGGCTFAKTICKSPEPERWLPVEFSRRRWDPITRTETPLPNPETETSL